MFEFGKVTNKFKLYLKLVLGFRKEATLYRQMLNTVIFDQCKMHEQEHFCYTGLYHQENKKK